MGLDSGLCFLISGVVKRDIAGREKIPDGSVGLSFVEAWVCRTRSRSVAPSVFNLSFHLSCPYHVGRDVTTSEEPHRREAATRCGGMTSCGVKECWASTSLTSCGVLPPQTDVIDFFCKVHLESQPSHGRFFVELRVWK